jgi:hypothetical protein
MTSRVGWLAARLDALGFLHNCDVDESPSSTVVGGLARFCTRQALNNSVTLRPPIRHIWWW